MAAKRFCAWRTTVLIGSNAGGTAETAVGTSRAAKAFAPRRLPVGCPRRQPRPGPQEWIDCGPGRRAEEDRFTESGPFLAMPTSGNFTILKEFEAMHATSPVRRSPSRAPSSENLMPVAHSRQPREAKPLLAHQVHLLDVGRIEPHPDNPRDDFADNDPELLALAQSLGEVKLIQPVSVVPAGDAASDRYLLVCGERRWRAAILAGWTVIPGFVLSMSPDEATRLIVDENLQRKDLNPIETARALRLLRRPKSQGGAGLSSAAASARFGRSESWCPNMLESSSCLTNGRPACLPASWKCATGRALAQHSDRPEVLAAVELDRQHHPDDWRGSDAFDRQLAIVVERLDGLAAGASNDSNEVAAAGGDGDVLPLRRRSAPVNHAASDEGPIPELHDDDLVSQIVELLSRITDPEQLAEVATATQTGLRSCSRAP